MSFKIGNISVERGQKMKGIMGSITMGDGTEVNIPVMVINGISNGPVLGITAGIHGPEVSGIWSLIKVFQELNPKQVSGTLIGIPAANPLSVQVGSYKTPIDGKNISGGFFVPPNPEGGTTERMSAITIIPLLKTVDYEIDLHSNPFPSMPFVLTDWTLCPDKKTRQETKIIADAFGLTVIEMTEGKVSGTRSIFVEKGIPAITPELAGNLYIPEEISLVGVRGIKNVMRAIGMLKGKIEPQKVDVMKGNFIYHGMLLANKGGLIDIKKKPGEKVMAGEIVIEIYNLYGEIVDKVYMPVDGYCWSFLRGIGGTHVVTEGDYLAFVFKERKDFKA